MYEKTDTYSEEIKIRAPFLWHTFQTHIQQFIFVYKQVFARHSGTSDEKYLDIINIYTPSPLIKQLIEYLMFWNVRKQS